MSAPTATDIHRDTRVVHSNPDYGRGIVTRVYWTDRQASVLFDGDAERFGGPLAGRVARRVWLRDLTPEPVDMPVLAAVAKPVCRVVWPIDSVVRADARQQIEDAMTGRGQ